MVNEYSNQELARKFYEFKGLLDILGYKSSEIDSVFYSINNCSFDIANTYHSKNRICALTRNPVLNNFSMHLLEIILNEGDSAMDSVLAIIDYSVAPGTFGTKSLYKKKQSPEEQPKTRWLPRTTPIIKK